MPFDSNGRYSLPAGYLATTGQTILASQHNPPLEDIGAALSQTLLRTGVAPMVADLPMGGFRVTGLATGVASTDAATVGQTSALATAAITGAPTKATPVDADTIPLIDSAAGNTLKRITWANLKALFQPASTVLNALAAIGTAVAGDIIYATGAGTWGRRAKGADGQILQLSSGVPAWAAGPIFTKAFQSAQITLSMNSSTSVAHGLGVQPKLFAAALVCTTNEFGYVVGDEVQINVNTNSSSGSSGGISMYVNGTVNIGIRIGNFISVWDKFGGIFAVTPSSWKLVVRAWA